MPKRKKSSPKSKKPSRYSHQRHYKQTVIRKSIPGTGTTRKTIAVGTKKRKVHITVKY